MIKAEHFSHELALIADEELATMISSSGKYHPQFSQGKGGLVRHTKAVVLFAEELLRMSSYSFMREDHKDFVIAACILHDTIKYGFNENIDKAEYKNHAKNAAYAFRMFCLEHDYQPSEYLLGAIRSHMGQWSTDKDDKPFTPIDRCVHMADYMASRSFIDIPQVKEQYNEAENIVIPF